MRDDNGRVLRRAINLGNESATANAPQKTLDYLGSLGIAVANRCSLPYTGIPSEKYPYVAAEAPYQACDHGNSQ